MTIKTKLIANVLLTAAIIIAISLSSFFSFRFLQEKLSYLIEKSTPFQMRTIELQRELQECITTLTKVNAARTMTEYTTFRAEAEKSLALVENTQKSLEQMSNTAPEASGELVTIALEIFAASEERINSNNAATSANAKVLQRMKESTFRLNDLDASIRNLQLNYSKAFAVALENTGSFSDRLRNIEGLRNLVRELQLIAVTVQNAQSGSVLLIAKAKLKSVTSRITRNDYFKSNNSIATITTGFIDKLSEYIKHQTTIIAQNDGDSKSRAAEAGKDLLYKLNDLFQTLDQETMLVRDELTLAGGRQGSIFAQSSVANSILVANSELVALGLMVSAETNQLFALDSLAALDIRDSEIRSLFAKIRGREQILENSFIKLNSTKELKLLNTATASLSAINDEIYSVDGIVSTLKKKLKAIEQANVSADKLRNIVIKQSVKGNESVLTARSEQEKAIAAVNNMVRQSLSQILGIGSVAIVVGIFFGFWIYRSVLLPLRVVLDAVGRQQEQVTEKASLAEAVAGGDLTREVHVSEAISLDPAQMKKDEMGMVLNAVVGMSEAQVTLDRAFAGMTEALRTSRAEEDRRDRLKSGLHELHKIVRGEQNTVDLADRSLAFLATFLGAGVGIMYLYDSKDCMLQTLSTYAIPRSKRLNGGFRLGEGLAGQVASERKMVCLDAVPVDYLPIASALGNGNPLNVVIMPILHNDTLVGVLELGSFRRFSSDDFEFLDQSLEGIAIAININCSQQLVNELLEQAQ
jgi:putative methionine-R-sulfoxide reductase with GAF domain